MRKITINNWNLTEVFRFKVSKHDRYIQELCQKIKYEYDSLSTNVKIKKKKRSLGEVDVLAKKGKLIDLYEVKCSFRIVKARKQAKSLRQHLQKINNIYFYCGATSSLILLWGYRTTLFFVFTFLAFDINYVDGRDF